MLNITKRSTVGAGETITTISVGHGWWEIVAVSVTPSSSFSTVGNILWGVTEGGVNKWTHLDAGFATGRHPLVLITPRKVRGPGGIVAQMIHLEATDYHTIYASFRRLRDAS